MNFSCVCFVLFVFRCHVLSSAQNTGLCDDDENASSATRLLKESKLAALVARAQDQSYHFAQDLKTSGEGPVVFENLDCSADGARWDYNYQVAAIYYPKVSFRSPKTDLCFSRLKGQWHHLANYKINYLTFKILELLKLTTTAINYQLQTIF